MDEPSRLSRRRVLGLAAGAGAAAALAGAGTVALTPPVGSEGGRSAGFLAVPARVTVVNGTTVRVEALDVEQEPTEPWAAVPVAGFPWGLVPRVGDHVSITDGLPGMALAAVPLSSWVKGVPATSSGAYQVGGRRTVAAAQLLGAPATALADAAATSRRVAVALGDTDRPDALVFQVRDPEPPPAGSTGA